MEPVIELCTVTHTQTYIHTLTSKTAFTKEIFYNNGEYVPQYFIDSYICLLLNFTSLQCLKKRYFAIKFPGFFSVFAPCLFNLFIYFI